MKFARPASTLAILAIAGATALAACGKSGTSNPTSTSSGTVGNAPKEWPELSLADLPKYSNGNKTVTITMKPNYVWSDGKPVTSQDVRFFLEMVKAGIKESPANWFAYTPKIGIPDEIASMSTPSPT